MTVSELVAGCLETWSETGPAVRRKAVGELRAEDGVYTDPVAVAAGRGQIDATIAAVHGHRLRGGVRPAHRGSADQA
jgi:hypothetical protein